MTRTTESRASSQWAVASGRRAAAGPSAVWFRAAWLGGLVLAVGACAPARMASRSATGSVTGHSPLATGHLPTGPAANLAHLDFLGEDVVLPGAPTDTLRFVHIYAEAPDWRFVGDDDEGIACVDDAARAAVVYLRHYELTRSERSRRTAVKLLRFVRHQQAPNGLFYNFIWDRALRPNTEHPNSVPVHSWWAARAVWALGTGARVLAGSPEAAADIGALRRLDSHLDNALGSYGETREWRGRTFPEWFWARGSDATSELLLGLISLERAAPTVAGTRRAQQFAEALGMVRFGTLAETPYGGHAAWAEGWHGWGNSQTMALAEGVGAGVLPPSALASAEAEARTLYAHLLVEGWLHEINYAVTEYQGDRTDAARPASERAFEQIAYDVRPAAVGLVRLHEATGDARYGVMAGLAAAWFAGDNPAGAVMADPASGRGYDGILAPDRINGNAGAESTVEAQMTLLEAGQDAAAAPWMHARGDAPRSGTAGGRALRYRVWTAAGTPGRRAVVVLDAAADTSSVYVGPDADAFLASLDP